MTIASWNNDSNLRSTTLVRLGQALESGRLGTGSNTPFVVILEGESPRFAEKLVGISTPFAFLVDGIYLGLPTQFARQDWALEVIYAINPNADLKGAVPAVMESVLTTLQRHLAETDPEGIKTSRQHDVLEDAVALVRRAHTVDLTGSEDDVRAVLRQPSQDWSDYIARAAVEAVLRPVVKEPATMLDVDKKRISERREANGQSAGMSALSTIRSAVEVLVNHAKAVALESQPGDMSFVRQAEENARSIFFNGLADTLLATVSEAPTVIWGTRMVRGFGFGIAAKRPAPSPVRTAPASAEVEQDGTVVP